MISRRERDERLEAARDRASVIPPPPSRRGDRVKGEDLLTDVFEAVSELFFLQDALDGADFVLRLALEKLPCEVGLLSLFDIDKRHFVVVRQTGGDQSALLHRLQEKHPIAKRVMRTPGAVVVPRTSKEPEMVDTRWEATGVEPKSLLLVPVQKSGRYLGMIELCNPYDGKAFRDSDANALSYMAEQFADFLDERGLLLDPDAVIAQAEAQSKRK